VQRSINKFNRCCSPVDALAGRA